MDLSISGKYLRKQVNDTNTIYQNKFNNKCEMAYKVYDSVGVYIKSFQSYDAANTFRVMNGRMDWKIKKI